MHQEQSHTCCPSAKIKTQKLAHGNCDLKKPNWQHNTPRQSYTCAQNAPVCTSDFSAQEPNNLTSVIYYLCWS